jgi:pimeloyl-ACP methyl ester carboxylesterase
MIGNFSINSNGINQNILLRSGDLNKTILFIHGNGSDSTFWNSLMARIPESYHLIASDLRGYGNSERVPADGYKSFGDYVSDLTSLMDELGVRSYSVISHSLGGGIAWELLIRNPERIKGLVQVNPASPFGFGGSCDERGTLTYSDGAGSGGGIVNPDFVECLKQKDRSTGNLTSPLNVMNAFYWAPPFSPDNIDELLESLLRMEVGDKFYPGDHKESENFPFTSPGRYGQLNAASPLTKQVITERITSLESKPPILWIRGGKDQIVADESMFDPAVLGKLGLMPGYPGVQECPPQPMIKQTRYVLEKYSEAGGRYEEVVMEDCGHSPYIEDENTFLEYLNSFLASVYGK